jgi:hypothetical protein
VGLALDLLDEVTRTADRLRPVLLAIEEVTGLGPGQVQTLLTIGQWAPGNPPGVPGAAGTEPATDWSTDLTITDLMARGLLETAAAPTDGAPARARQRLTERGLAVLSQVQGVQIRILDTLVSALGDRRVGELRDSLRAVGAVLEELPTRTGEQA